MRGLTAALATRHGKELLVDRALRALGIELLVAPVDTDRFGTFDGEIPRMLSPLDTAIAKARAALDAEPRAQLGVGSEGTFDTLNRELVAIVHRSAPLVVVGRASGEIVRVGARVETLIAAEDAAEHLGFPSAGVLVMTPQRRRVGGEVPHCGILRDLVGRAIAEHGAAWIEPDRRAHRDAARRRVIEAAALDASSKLREALRWDAPPPGPLADCEPRHP